MKIEKIEKIVINAINSELKEYNRSLLIDDNGKWKEAEFKSDLGMDSLKVVEAFLICEKECGITFTDDEIVRTKSVGDLINKIQEKVAQND